MFTEKDILDVFREEVCNRAGISRGGSSAITRNDYTGITTFTHDGKPNYSDREPSFLFSLRPKDPDPRIEEKISFKSCDTCKRRPSCQSLCIPNQRAFKKMEFEERSPSFRYGPVLEEDYDILPHSVPELFSAMNIGFIDSPLLKDNENQVLQTLYWENTKHIKGVYNAVARALSIPFERVKTMRRSARKKDPSNPYFWKPVHAPPILDIPSMPSNLRSFILTDNQKNQIRMKCDLIWGTNYIREYNDRIKPKDYAPFFLPFRKRRHHSFSTSLRCLSQRFWKGNTPRIPRWAQYESEWGATGFKTREEMLEMREYILESKRFRDFVESQAQKDKEPDDLILQEELEDNSQDFYALGDEYPEIDLIDIMKDHGIEDVPFVQPLPPYDYERVHLNKVTLGGRCEHGIKREWCYKCKDAIFSPYASFFTIAPKDFKTVKLNHSWSYPDLSLQIPNRGSVAIPKPFIIKYLTTFFVRRRLTKKEDVKHWLQVCTQSPISGFKVIMDQKSD